LVVIKYDADKLDKDSKDEKKIEKAHREEGCLAAQEALPALYEVKVLLCRSIDLYQISVH